MVFRTKSYSVPSTASRIVTLFATALASIVCLGDPCNAGEVRVGLSRTKTSVALPVDLTVVIQYSADAGDPTIPDVAGLSIESLGPPQLRSNRTIINGRVSEYRAEIYRFRVTPQREGTFTIPPLNLKVDGEAVRTRELSLEVAPIEESDLLILEVTGKQDSVYVGEALDLTLKIWIKPFESQKFDVQLAAESMWRTISDSSNWGPFEDAIQDLAERRRRPKAEEFLREDKDGKASNYYLFELNTTIYPKQAGSVETDEISVIANYPAELRRDSPSDIFGGFPFGRDPFEGIFPSRNSLRIGRTEPTIAQTSIDQIEVKPIPVAGMPADYRGAVGEYTIRSVAEPTRVKAGEPITLQMVIEGDGPLDLVQAPPLAELETFTDDFRVVDQTLAGIVQNERKYFTTKIRPLKSGLKEIPGIPLSYFDPEQEQFVTVMSDPIPISVAEGEALNLAKIISSKRASTNLPNSPNVAATTSSEFPANIVGSQLLLNQTSHLNLGWQHLMFLIAPPVLCLLVVTALRRKQVASSLTQLRSPLSQAITRIEDSQNTADVLHAIQEFLTRRLKISVDSTTLVAVGELRQRGHEEIAIEFERLFSSLEDGATWNTDAPVAESLRQESQELLRKADSELSQRFKRRFASSGSAGLFLALALSSTTVAVETNDASEQRNDSLELAEIVKTADEAYRLSIKSDDAEARRTLAANAAEKYQFVVDRGIRNNSLHRSAANAYFVSKQYGWAIAHYRQALRIDPTDSVALNMLNRSRSAIAVNDEQTPINWKDQSQSVLQWFWTVISPSTCRLIALFSWSCLWIIPVLAFWKGKRAGYILPAILAALTTIAFGALFLLAYLDSSSDDLAVLVVENVDLRTGDGANFPISSSLSVAEGKEVTVQSQRGDWLLVDSDSINQPGWIQKNTAVLLD